MNRWLASVWMLLVLAVSGAVAQIVPSLPITLQNGTTADATQVMANFNAIVNGVNANGAKNGVNTDITALSSLSTPITPAQGGSTTYVGGTSSGTANAQAVAISYPGGFSLTVGTRVVFTAGFGNTAAATLNVNATGAKPIYRLLPGAPGALGGGEIVVAQMVNVVYDGSAYQLQNSAVTELPGTSVSYRGTTAPLGFFLEDGTPISRSTYAALFAAIGTTYGAGDGMTTFNLPDSRGRLDAGRDDQGGVAANRITNAGSGCTGTTLGLGCGVQNHTIAVGELPSHTHPSSTVTNDAHTHFVAADQDALTGVPANSTNTTQVFSRNTTGSAIGFSLGTTGTAATVGLTSSTSGFVTLSANTGSTGSGTAAAILNPLLVTNKMIRY